MKECMIPWIEGTNESADNIAFYLYLQQAYKPHDPIPTTQQLKENNPHWKEWRRLEKEERAKGIHRYKLPELQQTSS